MNEAISIGMVVIGVVLAVTGLWILRGTSSFRGRITLGIIMIALGIGLVATAMSTLEYSSPKQHSPPGRLECKYSDGNGCAIVPTN